MNYLETERLILRDWKEEDLPAFVQMNADPEVMEYFVHLLSEAETQNFYRRIRQELDAFGYGLYAVEVKDSGEFIGYIGLHHTHFEVPFCPCVEIGWRLMKAAWGKGYATEGAKACLEDAFGRLGLSEVYSFTSVPNKRSERVMQKIGLQKVDEFDHPMVPAGHPLLRHLLYRGVAPKTAFDAYGKL